jgi:Transglycosylase SLT domain
MLISLRATATKLRHPGIRLASLLLSGLLTATPLPGGGFAEELPPMNTDPMRSYAAHITEASRRFRIPAPWIAAVLRAESAGDSRAVSAKGAMGLMQIMPDTWEELRARYALGSDAYDPRDNILAGAAYLKELHNRFGSSGFLAAYNAGPGRYQDSLSGRPLPSETRAYVQKLLPFLDAGESPVPVTSFTGEQRSWTIGPLFVAQSHRPHTADAGSTEQHSNDASAAPAVRDVSAIVPQSGGLFVARSKSGER